MKKSLLILGVTALVFAGCSNDVLLDDMAIQKDNQMAISFNTFTSKQTRAENSSATATNALEDYNTTFKVWGYKFVGGTAAANRSDVFTGDVVSHEGSAAVLYTAEEAAEYNTTNNLTDTDPDYKHEGDVKTAAVDKWSYSPARFWDKSATHYSFYAASPSGKNWQWNASTYKFTLANFVLSGYNSVTGTPATAVDPAKVLTDGLDTEDLMISTDIPEYKNYTSATVNLHFNHILSRLNIGVRKADILTDFDVTLNSIMVYNMKKGGSFDESLESGDDLLAGTIARWNTTSAELFTNGVGYEPATALTVSSNETSNNYQYVYEGLVIPQAVAYKSTVEVATYNAAAAADQANLFKLDGSNATTTSDPYIVIDYTIHKDAVNYTAAEATAFNTANNLTSTDPGYKNAGDVKIAEINDNFKYYYNLADVFNGTTENAVNFFEGWQNTLMITLSPVAINFDAVVYQWVTKEGVEVNITEEP